MTVVVGVAREGRVRSIMRSWGPLPRLHGA
jgi:hypothetical protein